VFDDYIVKMKLKSMIVLELRGDFEKERKIT
jgi:hypothetical protein